MSTTYRQTAPTRQKIDDTTAISRPPGDCGVFGCRDKPSIFTLVVCENGHNKGGAFSDFGYTKSGIGGITSHLRNGIEFVRWIARCDNHHLDDLYRAGKGVRSCFGAGTDRFTQADIDAYVPNPAWAEIGHAFDPAKPAGPMPIGAALADVPVVAAAEIVKIQRLLGMSA